MAQQPAAHVRVLELEPAFEMHGQSLEAIWHPRARLVLPPVTSPDLPHKLDPHEEAEQSLRLVRAAAEIWQEIADKWEVVMVPHLAPPGTEAEKRFMDRVLRLLEGRGED